MSTTLVPLAGLERAVRLLAEARSLDEVAHIRAAAYAAEEYARAEQLGDEAVRYATEIRVRAARKAGELLRDMAETGERFTRGPGNVAHGDIPTLPELGITRDQSSRWQAIAEVPDETFEAAVADPAVQLSEGLLERAGRTGTDPRMGVHYSSADDDWHTPSHIVELVQGVLGSIDLDPCSNVGAPNVPAAQHFTAEADGLSYSWVGRVYMNPPYGRVIDTWISKLVESYQQGGVTEAIALVPARTDTAWFRLLRAFPRCFITGRLRFSGADPAPFPSVAVYLGPRVSKFVAAFTSVGDCYALLEAT